MKITINDSKLKSRLKAMEKKYPEGASMTARQLARIGKVYGQIVAPKDTGATMRSIMDYTGDNKFRASIIAHNSTPNRADGFNLPLWMHTSPRALSHIKTGDPQFMQRVVEFLNSKKVGVATINVKKMKV